MAKTNWRRGPFPLRSCRMKAIAVIASVFLIGQTARTLADEPLCMSDSELRANLANVGMFGLGVGAAVCASRFKSLRKKILSQTARTAAALDPYSKQVNKIAIQPFRRSFGVNADKMFHRYETMATKVLKGQAAKYSERQCGFWLSSLQAFEDVEGKGIEKYYVEPIFARERQRVPTC